MKRKARVRITNIFRRATIQERQEHAFCKDCCRRTVMLTTAECAVFMEVEPRMVLDLFASGKIHGIRTVAGNLRVCKNSLFAGGENQ